MQANQIKKTQERDHYRIDDELEFTYANTPDKLLPSQLMASHQFLQMISDIDQQIDLATEQLAGENSRVGDCLTLLNQKINYLMNQTLQSSSLTRQPINLSAGGLAFHTHESLEIGQDLQLAFMLRTSCRLIICRGRILTNRYLPKVSAKRPHRIALQFDALHESDREIINQHVMQIHRSQLSVANAGINADDDLPDIV